jgi:sugar phosphate isomerase/epimerase
MLPYRFSLETIAEVAYEAGLDGLEVVLNSAAIDQIEQVHGRHSSLAVPILSLHAPYQRTPQWGGLARALLKTIEAAPRVGASRVVFHPPTVLTLSPQFGSLFWGTKNFQRLGNGQVLISMENLPRHFFSDVPRIMRNPLSLKNFLLERNLFLTLDCSHFASHGHSLEKAAPMFGPLITSVHLTNTQDCRIDQHLAPQEGCLDLCGFLEQLRKLRLPHALYLVFEIDFGMKEAGFIRDTLVRSREFIDLALSGQ